VADILILGAIAGPELWTYNSRTWHFGSACCTAYRGLSEFASAASSYLIATLALHTIATVNLEEKAIEKKLKRSREDDYEIRSSHHSLVASSDSSTPPRTMNVDYRPVDVGVRVGPPSLFIWILAASLSIPQFISALTVTTNEGITLCTVKDSYHSIYMNSLLTAFNLLVPALIICIAGVLVMCKLNSKKILSDSVQALKLSLCLIILYCVFCVPRLIIIAYRDFSINLSDNQLSSFEELQLSGPISTLNFALTCTYMLAAVIRPVLTFIMLPRFKKLFKFGSTMTEAV
jgi:hypothetical protein